MITDDDHKLDRILRSTNLDEYELIDLPMEQNADSLQKHTGVGMAPTLDTSRTSGSYPMKGVQ